MDVQKPTTKLRIYSLGVVVETKPPFTDYILVSPVEDLNLQEDGSIKDYKKDYDGSKKELESKGFKTEHESRNYIQAKWIPYGESNRTTAPDVRANETVLLFKYEDVDEFYWTDMLREPELRRLEHVLYSYSNLPEGLDAYDKTTSYWQEISTQKKFWHTHTADNDGEVAEYNIRIDGKEGYIHLYDNKGNYIKIDTPSGTITVEATQEVLIKAPRITELSTYHTISTTYLSVSATHVSGNVSGGSVTSNVNNLNMTNNLSDVHIQTNADTYTNERNITNGKLETNLQGTKATTVDGPINVTSTQPTTNTAPVIVNDTPTIQNTGNIETSGSSDANPHNNISVSGPLASRIAAIEAEIASIRASL